MSFSFPKFERIRRTSVFEHLLSSGKIVRDQTSRFHYLPSSEAYSSLGIAVPKRNIKKAADRNLIKRRIREIYRQHKPNKRNYLLLCVYQAKSICTYDELHQSIVGHLKTIHDHD